MRRHERSSRKYEKSFKAKITSGQVRFFLQKLKFIKYYDTMGKDTWTISQFHPFRMENSTPQLLWIMIQRWPTWILTNRQLMSDVQFYMGIKTLSILNKSIFQRCKNLCRKTSYKSEFIPNWNIIFKKFRHFARQNHYGSCKFELWMGINSYLPVVS